MLTNAHECSRVLTHAPHRGLAAGDRIIRRPLHPIHNAGVGAGAVAGEHLHLCRAGTLALIWVRLSTYCTRMHTLAWTFSACQHCFDGS